MALNFSDIAKKKVDEIERPPLPPVGTYRFSIRKIPEVSEINSPNGNWDVLNIQCQAIEALDDVDMEDYKGEVSGITMRHSFMFDKNDEVKFAQTEFGMKRFFEEHCGIKADTVGEMLNASVNAQFLGTIGWKPDKTDPELFHANITRTAPVE